MKILFDRICTLCAANGITERELEVLCGLSRLAIAKWEKGSAFIENVQKVADYFDVSVDFLIGKTDNPKSHKNKKQLIDENNRLKDAVQQYKLTTERFISASQHLMGCLAPHIVNVPTNIDDNLTMQEDQEKFNNNIEG